MQISMKSSQANQAVLLVRSASARRFRTDRGKLGTARRADGEGLENLEKRLTEVETSVSRRRTSAWRMPLNFPIMLNNKVSALQCRGRNRQTRRRRRRVTRCSSCSARRSTSS